MSLAPAYPLIVILIHSDEMLKVLENLDHFRLRASAVCNKSSVEKKSSHSLFPVTSMFR